MTIHLGKVPPRDPNSDSKTNVKKPSVVSPWATISKGTQLAVTLLLGVATLGTVILVFLLSIRLRRGEMATMRKLGCSRRFVLSLLAGEAAVVTGAALIVAALLTLLTASLAESLIRALIV